MSKNLTAALICLMMCSFCKVSFAVNDPAVDFGEKCKVAMMKVTNVTKDAGVKIEKVTSFKIGGFGDLQLGEKLQSKLDRLKELGDKARAGIESLQKTAAVLQETRAEFQAELDNLKKSADSIMAEYQKAQEQLKKAQATIKSAESKFNNIKDSVKSGGDRLKSAVSSDGASSGSGGLKNIFNKIPFNLGQKSASGSAPAAAQITSAPDEDDFAVTETYAVDNLSVSDTIPDIAADTAASKAEITEETIFSSSLPPLMVPVRAAATIKKRPIQADVLSAINDMLDEPSTVNTKIVAPLLEQDDLLVPTELSAEEILQNAEEIDIDADEKTELITDVDLTSQLQKLSADKLVSKPQITNKGELIPTALPKAEILAKPATVSKQRVSFEAVKPLTANTLKGDKNVD